MTPRRAPDPLRALRGRQNAATGDAAGRCWIVTVPGLLPLPNDTNASALRRRLHLKRAWRDWTVAAVRAAGVPYLGRACVTFTRYSAGRPDDDAIPAAFKHCRDALIGPDAVIADDDAAHLRATYRAATSTRRDARIELEVRPWE